MAATPQYTNHVSQEQDVSRRLYALAMAMQTMESLEGQREGADQTTRRVVEGPRGLIPLPENIGGA